MSAFELVLSAEAINDLDQAVEYYNSLSDGLGFEFADTIDRYLRRLNNCLQLLLSGMMMYAQSPSILFHLRFIIL